MCGTEEITVSFGLACCRHGEKTRGVRLWGFFLRRALLGWATWAGERKKAVSEGLAFDGK